MCAMQLDFKKIWELYDPFQSINGIVHVGACTGEERDAYADCGVEQVLWFEANPESFKLLQENITPRLLSPDFESRAQRFSRNRAFNVCLSDADDEDVEFYVTSNFRSASSSMLKLGKHSEHYPQITVQQTLKLKTKRFDTFVRENSLNLRPFNFLNMDVQGAELKVLKGVGDELLKNFDYVYSEVNTAELYQGCVLLDELESYLEERGFVMREINMTPYEWGDALLVRKQIIV